MAQGLSPSDPSSFSKPEECIITFLHLDLTVDFSSEILAGRVKIDARKSNPGIKTLVCNPY